MGKLLSDTLGDKITDTLPVAFASDDDTVTSAVRVSCERVAFSDCVDDQVGLSVPVGSGDDELVFLGDALLERET